MFAVGREVAAATIVGLSVGPTVMDGEAGEIVVEELGDVLVTGSPPTPVGKSDELGLNVEATTSDGTTVKLASVDGKIVVITLSGVVDILGPLEGEGMAKTVSLGPNVLFPSEGPYVS